MSSQPLWLYQGELQLHCKFTQMIDVTQKVLIIEHSCIKTRGCQFNYLFAFDNDMQYILTCSGLQVLEIMIIDITSKVMRRIKNKGILVLNIILYVFVILRLVRVNNFDFGVEVEMTFVALKTFCIDLTFCWHSFKMVVISGSFIIHWAGIIFSDTFDELIIGCSVNQMVYPHSVFRYGMLH